ncbi:hypothetical protein [Motilibacter aurantiacus]|uniref:hypothetical protein n=1 Tax=Motilibacter aurantiacus TaxID=2714955 RepID=UPI0018C8978F|nr:hypothetical protein [Motilibacter aurantiacus]
MDPGKQPVLLLLAGLVSAFAASRTSTRLIRAQVRWWPGNISVRGVHLHHELFGVLLMLASGLLAFTAAPVTPWRDLLGLMFGVGAGLVLDEFALLLHLEDVYWQEQGRASIDAVLVVTGVTLMLLVGWAPLGIPDATARQEAGRWVVVGYVGLNLGVAVVTALKGKLWLALVCVVVPVVGLVPASRLAEPRSPWARWLYAPGSRRAQLAEQRAEPWRRRRRQLATLIGGHVEPGPAGSRPAGHASSVESVAPLRSAAA